MVEVVLALAIISLLAALALPFARLDGGRAMVTIKASELVAFLRADRNVALSVGRRVVTRIDPAGGRIYAGGSDRVFALSGSIPLQVAAPDRNSLWFSPDGHSSGGRIILGKGMRARTISVDPFTAAIQVEGR